MEVEEGRGVFVDKDIIPKGAFVCNYGGEFLTSEYAKKHLLDYPEKCDYLIELSETSNGKQKTFYLNPSKNKGLTFGQLLNHSNLHPNLGFKIFETAQNTLDVIFVAITKIQRGEQLVWDYGKNYTGVNDCVSQCRRCMQREKKRKEKNK